jgi:hypothetical protein
MRRWDRLLDVYVYLDEYRARGVSGASVAYRESRLERWGCDRTKAASSHDMRRQAQHRVLHPYPDARFYAIHPL